MRLPVPKPRFLSVHRWGKHLEITVLPKDRGCAFGFDYSADAYAAAGRAVLAITHRYPRANELVIEGWFDDDASREIYQGIDDATFKGTLLKIQHGLDALAVVVGGMSADGFILLRGHVPLVTGMGHEDDVWGWEKQPPQLAPALRHTYRAFAALKLAANAKGIEIRE